MHVYDIAEGRELVRGARSAIELYLVSPKFERRMVEDGLKRFGQAHGVFVTIEHYPTRSLRGCIGFPNPVSTLKSDLVEAALAAAVGDPRFPPVSKRELEHITIEVSLLSPRVELAGSAAGRRRGVVVGRDGLVAVYGLRSGLLLPIVAVEQGWKAERFLEETCAKAGLPGNYWMQPNVKIYKFETQVFKEESPNGNVIEVRLE